MREANIKVTCPVCNKSEEYFSHSDIPASGNMKITVEVDSEVVLECKYNDIHHTCFTRLESIRLAIVEYLRTTFPGKGTEYGIPIRTEEEWEKIKNEEGLGE